ncbi:MAG: hypothetical protein NTZ28_13045 [Nitrospirae bacterium]|nr:hypothetical protein [Nitrospirota bacterium]
MRRTLSLLIVLLGLAIPTFYALACVYEIEVNNYADYADLIGTVPGSVCGVGTIGEAGDIDVWKFEITQPALIRIETSATMYEGDTVIGLYDENLRLVGSDDDSGEDYLSLIDFEATGQILDPGYYYVAVWDADPAFSSRQPYQVTVSGYVPESKPESTPPDSRDCDMSEHTQFTLGFTMHLNTNQSHDDEFSDYIWNAGAGAPPLCGRADHSQLPTPKRNPAGRVSSAASARRLPVCPSQGLFPPTAGRY